ncbi:hypothetical protein NQ118_17135 [Enterobacter kobei]|nr:hypothetical protein [Enterobacter kobei]MCR2771767.1 hypothetical protein [Enterobacter kobei]
MKTLLTSGCTNQRGAGQHGQKVTFQEGPYEFTSEGKAWLFGTNFNYAF